MKRILLIIFSFFILSFISQYLPIFQIAYAFTLFKDSMGSEGSNWEPNGWIQISGHGKYGNDGVMGFTQNFRDFGIRDIIVKFEYNIHAHDTTVLFACRANSDFSEVIQPSLNPDGLTHIDECDNVVTGTGSCFRDLPPSNLTDVPYDQSIGTHHIKLICVGNNILEEEDEKQLIQTTSTANLSTGVRFYLTQGSNTISNLEVCDAFGCDDDITPIPTPTLTPTPTEINLNVPLIKQTSDPWQSQEYDTAHLWNSISTTIHDWGCALTSAVMALQYNGITKMPNNTPLDPASLNTWLISQPDGYIGNGLVNWLAIPRLSRLAKLSFNNPNFTSDALEYKRIQGNSNDSIASDLKKGVPDILEEPGHFVIAKGTQGSTFTINDPYYDRSLLTDTYDNSFLHAGKFVPSNTDLSYLMFTGSGSLSFNIKTASGSSINDSFIQQPMENDAIPGQTSGSSISIAYVQQPTDDTYQLLISGQSSQIYNVKGFLYDVEGNVKPFILQGILDNNHPDTFTIISNKETQSVDKITKQVSFSSLIFELNTLFAQKKIQKGSYISLHNLISNAQKAQAKHRLWEAKLLLNISLIMINAEKKWGMNEQAFQLLYADISFLKSSL